MSTGEATPLGPNKDEEDVLLENEEVFFAKLENLQPDMLRNIFDLQGLGIWRSFKFDVFWIMFSVPALFFLIILGSIVSFSPLIKYPIIIGALLLFFGSARLLVHVCTNLDVYAVVLFSNRKHIETDPYTHLVSIRSLLTPLHAKSIPNAVKLKEFYEPKKESEKSYFSAKVFISIDCLFIIFSLVQMILTMVPPMKNQELSDSDGSSFLYYFHMMFFLEILQDEEIMFWISLSGLLVCLGVGGILTLLCIVTGDPRFLRGSMVCCAAKVYILYFQEEMYKMVEGFFPNSRVFVCFLKVKNWFFSFFWWRIVIFVFRFQFESSVVSVRK